jgi:hypothetical protein
MRIQPGSVSRKPEEIGSGGRLKGEPNLRHEEVVAGGQVQGVIPERDVELHFLSRDGAVHPRIDRPTVRSDRRAQEVQALWLRYW